MSLLSFHFHICPVSSINFLVPPSFQSLGIWAMSPTTIPSSFCCTCGIPWSNGHSSQVLISVLYSGHPLRTRLHWLGVASLEAAHLQENLTANNLCASPFSLLLSYHFIHHPSASSRLQFLAPALGSQGWTFSLSPTFLFPPAEMRFSDFSTFTHAPFSLTFLAFATLFWQNLILDEPDPHPAPRSWNFQESHMRANWF